MNFTKTIMTTASAALISGAAFAESHMSMEMMERLHLKILAICSFQSVSFHKSCTQLHLGIERIL